MVRSLTVWLTLANTFLAVCAVAPSASAATPPLRIAADGRPDLGVGIDRARLTDKAYVEGLSTASERLSALRAKIMAAVAEPADLVDFGYATGSGELVVYWSGALDAPALVRIQRLARTDKIGLIVAARKVSKAQLSAATNRIAADPRRYEGIVLSGYGGFTADFDGMHVFIDPVKSAVKDLPSIEATLQADLGIPVSATLGAFRTTAGKYDDFAPFNGGAVMIGALLPDGNRHFCTTGFGVIYGSSVFRYLSARHCGPFGPFHAPSGESMGTQILTGTGFNGAGVYSAPGSEYVFDGSNQGNPTSARLLTQKDPGLSTVGVVVCQEGANMGQQCGPIRQVALNADDQYGTMRVNWVTNYNSSIMLAEGDSGAAVISLHTQGRAWAVGIAQGFYESNYDRVGSTACGTHYASPDVLCSNNFVFTNVDYALSGFTAHGINYY